jgi:hypothetical protein
VHLEAVEVGDDQERRVFEVFAVLEELDVGVTEVLALLLVFPGEVAAFLDVGEAIAAGGLGSAFLEGVVLAGGVGVGDGVVEEGAEVDEVFLGGGAFGLGGGRPLGGEFGEGEGWHGGIRGDLEEERANCPRTARVRSRLGEGMFRTFRTRSPC